MLERPPTRPGPPSGGPSRSVAGDRRPVQRWSSYASGISWDHFQYLGLMAACLLVTLPLELVLGARVWRRPRRWALSVLPTAAAFSLWDVLAIHDGTWRFARRYVTGVRLPGRLPIEEVVFFLVVPTCALLTYECVRRALAREHGAGQGAAGQGPRERGATRR